MASTPASAVVVTAAPGLEGVATLTAAGLGFGTAAAPPTEGLALHLDERGWALRDGDTVVRADFVHGRLAERVRRAHPGARRGEARLATALGLKRDPHPLVLDATAGLGRDSVLAAALGCRVIACERSAVVALLLRDALGRADAGGLREIASRIEVREADAREVMRDLAADGEHADVVLVDPMFPERSKAAKAQKEMQVLQRLLGAAEPGEDGSLLAAALAHARSRVIVKRPPHAPPIGGRAPSFVVEGKSARYDVYVVTPAPIARSA